MEKLDELPPLTLGKPAEENPKITYEAPHLVVHGKIEKLTLQTG